MSALLSLLICFGISTAVAMPVDLESFTKAKQQKKYEQLVTELRCLVCQNENLKDSNAKLAVDLRRKVFDMVQAGRSDTQIKTYLTSRYGDFILFSPPFKPSTWLLWLLPFIMLFLSGLILLRWLKRGQVANEALPS